MISPRDRAFILGLAVLAAVILVVALSTRGPKDPFA